MRLLSNISVWIAVLISICSLYPWFTWYLPINVYLPLLFIISRLPIIINTSIINHKILIVVFLYIVYAVVYCKFMIVEPRHNAIEFVLSIVPLGLIILFRNNELLIFYKRLIKIFSIVLLVSLLGFSLKTIGIELPFSILYHPNPWYNPYKNYYLFTVYNDYGLFTRFTSMMQEPGHIGMSCAILLYTTGYSLKRWYNIVMTVSLIWTFSLAGYVLYLIGGIIYIIAKHKSYVRQFLKILISISFLLPLVLFYYNYNKDSVVSSLVLSRFELDDKGGISGNNRNTEDFNMFYKTFLRSGESLLGMNYGEFTKKWGGTPNSSYKNFIMEKGIICTTLLVIFCLAYTQLFHTKIGYGLLILFVISFLQRPYFMWPIQSFTFIAMIRLWYYYNNKFKYDVNYENSLCYIS